MKTMVAIPCGDLLDVNFVNCLIHMKHVGEVQIGFLPGSLIYDARNALAKEAVEGGYDYVLWLDSDMTFSGDLLEKMFESLGDGDVLCGLYFERKGEHRPTVFTTCRLEVTDDDYKVVVERVPEIPSEKFEVEGCGFGCVLMRTEVIKTILDSQGNPFSPYFGIGEDLSFCIRTNACGYKIICDPSIMIGHMAHLPIGGQGLINQWNARKR